MIEQLVRFLAQIIFRKKSGDYAEAFREVESAVKNILGLDYGLLEKVSTDDIFSFIKKDELYSGVKLIILGKLIKEAAELKLRRSQSKDPLVNASGYTATPGNIPVNDYHKALALMLEGILTNKYHEVDMSNFYPDIKELDSLTANYQLPDSVYFNLFRFYSETGDYKNAETLLLELRENDYKGILEEGRQFYKKLLNMSDEELQKQNLIREEISENQESFFS